MKTLNKHPFLLVEDFLVEKAIENIEPGDLLVIGDHRKSTLDDTNPEYYVKYLKLVIVPEQGVTLTTGGNILAEGFGSFKISIRWLPRYTYKFLLGLITFGSFTEDGYIVNCSKSTNINYLFEPYSYGKVITLAKKEEFANFFDLKL